jgi:cytochrome bd-type quinol oxidase subunit 2
VLTVVAIVVTPLLLACPGWSYHVFRGRIKGPTAQATPAVQPSTAGESA